MDAKAVTERLVGPVQWENPVSGFCRCPGAEQHTMRTGARDCRVRIDGAPTVYCFHASCEEALERVNLELRRRLGGEEWTLDLGNGVVLRSGEVHVGKGITRGRRKGDKGLLDRLRAEMEARREGILEEFYWPYEEIVKRSPVAAVGRDGLDQFRLWLQIWPPSSTLWIGKVYDSGEGAGGHFRPVSEWYQVGPVMGNFTCGSTFRRGSTSRCEASVERRRFLVVESDELSRDEVGAVFMWMVVELGHRLRCVVDTGGKSLHGWFDAPPVGEELQLKACLTALWCDPKLFGRSQPVRVPGAMREEKMQRLLWYGGKR